MATRPLTNGMHAQIPEGDGDGAAYGTTPASAYGGYGSYTGTSGATGEYGSPVPGAYAPSATASYGQPSSLAYGSSPSYGASATPAYGQASPYAQPASYPAGSSYAQNRTTTNQGIAAGQTLSNWQPALPVSPWSTYERSSTINGGVESVSILKSDLKSLKRSRLKAWLYLFVWVCLVGTAGYFEMNWRSDLIQNTNKVKEQLVAVEQSKRELLTRMGTTQAAAIKAAAVPKAEPAASSGPVITPLGAAATANNADTLRLLEDLKRQLAGAPQISIEGRGDRVVVALEQSVLFSGSETDVGLSGYRTLYKFGKALKGVKDRRVTVAVPAAEGKRGRGWSLAASRSVSLGRFLVEDLGFEPARVTVSTGAPVAVARSQRGSSRIEFSLDPMPAASRS